MTDLSNGGPATDEAAERALREGLKANVLSADAMQRMQQMQQRPRMAARFVEDVVEFEPRRLDLDLDRGRSRRRRSAVAGEPGIELALPNGAAEALRQAAEARRDAGEPVAQIVGPCIELGVTVVRRREALHVAFERRDALAVLPFRIGEYPALVVEEELRFSLR